MKRVFVDADSCARRVRRYLLSRAKKNQIELFFAANKDLSNGEAVPNFTMQVCPKQSQAADNWILENAAQGDLVVTRDIPLAASLLQKNIRVINDYGKAFDKKSVERALKEREIGIQMAELGIGSKRRDSYGQKEFEEFAQRLDKEIQS